MFSDEIHMDKAEPCVSKKPPSEVNKTSNKEASTSSMLISHVNIMTLYIGIFSFLDLNIDKKVI